MCIYIETIHNIIHILSSVPDLFSQKPNFYCKFDIVFPTPKGGKEALNPRWPPNSRWPPFIEKGHFHHLVVYERHGNWQSGGV